MSRSKTFSCLVYLVLAASQANATMLLVPKEGDGIWTETARKEGERVFYTVAPGEEKSIPSDDLHSVIPVPVRGKDYSAEHVEQMLGRIRSALDKRPNLVKQLNLLRQQWKALQGDSPEFGQDIEKIVQAFSDGTREAQDYRSAILQLEVIQSKDVRGQYTDRLDKALEDVKLSYRDAEQRQGNVVPEKTPTPAPEPADPQAPALPGPSPELAEFARCMLSQDFDKAREALAEAKRQGVPGFEASAFVEMAEAVEAASTLPQLVLSSLKKDVGKQVTLLLKTGAEKFMIWEVDASGVTVRKVLDSSGTTSSSSKRRYELGELDPKEMAARLDRKQTPALDVMRGLLAYEMNAHEAAQKCFERSGDALGTVLAGFAQQALVQREAFVVARKTAAREAAAARAYRGLLRAAGIYTAESDIQEITDIIRRKKFNESEVSSTRQRLKAFIEGNMDADFSIGLKPVLDLLGKIVPNVVLYVDERTLKDLRDKLQEANPARAILYEAKVEDDSAHIDLRGSFEVSNIAPLKGLPVGSLDLTQTKVSDLSPLKGLPLRSLDLTEAPVADLGALAGLPIETLNLTKTPVTDLAALQGAPLRVLILADTQISNLTALAGLPLEELDLSRTKVKDLTPLQGMPLKQLKLVQTPVQDIRALQQCPFTNLNLQGTGVEDLSPLARIATLKHLNISSMNPKVKDLYPLRNLRLEFLNIQNSNVRSLKPIHGMPLQELVWNGNPLEMADVGKFWSSAGR